MALDVTPANRNLHTRVTIHGSGIRGSVRSSGTRGSNERRQPFRQRGSLSLHICNMECRWQSSPY